MDSIYVNVTDTPFDPAFEIAQMQDRHMGAISLFIGTVRDDHDENLIALHLEHYETMTQIFFHCPRSTEAMVTRQIRIIHRIGRLTPEDMIVLVAASSAHRSESLEAVHFIMDYLKTDAPF